MLGVACQIPRTQKKSQNETCHARNCVTRFLFFKNFYVVQRSGVRLGRFWSFAPTKLSDNNIYKTKISVQHFCTALLFRDKKSHINPTFLLCTQFPSPWTSTPIIFVQPVHSLPQSRQSRPYVRTRTTVLPTAVSELL